MKLIDKSLFIIVAALLLPGMTAVTASARGVSEEETVAATADGGEDADTDFVELYYNGVTLKVPQGAPVDMNSKEAVLKTADGSFGLSLKVEKEPKSSPQGAYEICQRLVTDLNLRQSQLSKVSINGLQGACVDGSLEGSHVAVLVLDAGKRYVKLVVICAPQYVSRAGTVIKSVHLD